MSTIAICGVCGQEPADDGGMAAMLAALTGRGAGRAAWTDGATALGVRSRAPRPAVAVDPSAGLAAAADVRLDDRGALCDALDVPRPDRAALGDADLVLRAYARWGSGCPARLLGDYAFAVWDARTRTLFCARDPAGVRPFYYARTGRGFVFASAVEAVLAAPGVPGDLDETAVATALTHVGLYTTTRTFFRAVRKLPPGHACTVRDGEMRAERHWRPEDAPRARPASDDAHAEEMLELYGRAVADRLRGEPAGVHLSGGLDSSSVAVMAARELRRRGQAPPPAFSWLPPPGGQPLPERHAPEYRRIDAVCVQEGLQVLHQAPDSAVMLDLWRRDGAYPGVHVDPAEEVVQRRAAQRGVRVLLSGLGGDEGVSFFGLGWRQQLLLTGRWRRLSADVRAAGGRPVRAMAGLALNIAHPRFAYRLHRWRLGEAPLHRHWFVDPAFARRVRPAAEWIPRPISLRRAQASLLRSGNLSVRIEGWGATGARRDIEYRYPLLDRRLLEFALGLPPEQFCRRGQRRWLMRHAFGGMPSGAGAALPPEVCWHADKAEPARHGALCDAVAGALPAVRRALAARAAPPSRARYVDMPRLIEHLDPARRRSEPRWGTIISTLQLLDF